jgi:hypothetical protein
VAFVVEESVDIWAVGAANHLRSQANPEQWSVRALLTAEKKSSARSDNSTDAVSHLASVTDRMHALLMNHADALMGCTENSPEEAELAAVTDVIEAYERQRWPDGKVSGGKG